MNLSDSASALLNPDQPGNKMVSHSLFFIHFQAVNPS